MIKKTAAALFLMGSHASAAHLTQAADLAFERYIANLEARLARQYAKSDTQLAMLNVEAGRRTTLERQLISGDIRVEPVNRARELTGALLHHWRAAGFVDNATPADMLALLRDYNHLSRHYAPEIAASRALKDDGDTAILAVRIKKEKIRTVVLDAEYRIETRLAGNDRGYSSSRSTHIWQIDDPGTPRERRRAQGDDDGFLWRLNSYWSFSGTRSGLFIECEAASLTRDVPIGLGWLITPIVQDLPSEALLFTLRATKNALMAIASRKAQG